MAGGKPTDLKEIFSEVTAKYGIPKKVMALALFMAPILPVATYLAFLFGAIPWATYRTALAASLGLSGMLVIATILIGRKLERMARIIHAVRAS